MDRMVAKQTDDLAANIEVFLQRVVSFVTEEEPIRRSLSLYGDSVIPIIEPYLEDWADCVRTAYGYGVLCSKLELEIEMEETRMSKIEVKLGDGTTIYGSVVVANSIQDSFNRVVSAEAPDELKELLQKLAAAVGKMSEALPSEAAQQVARDLDTLVVEATSKTPRKKWWQLSVEGLKQAATNVGAVGKPALELVARIVPLLK